MIRFGCGPYSCLVDAREVVGMGPGLADAVPLEPWLGLPEPRGEGGRRCLRLADAGGPAVAVSDPVRLVGVLAGSLHPLPPLIAAGCSLAIVRGIYLDEAGWGLVLSLRGVP